jgi:hypothetical protein
MTKMKKMKNNKIWGLYMYKNNTTVVCKNCNSEIEHNPNDISNLKEHLNSLYCVNSKPKEPPLTKPSKNEIWNHFKLLGGDRVSCHRCGKEMFYKTENGPGNLKAHIKTKKCLSYLEGEKQQEEKVDKHNNKEGTHKHIKKYLSGCIHYNIQPDKRENNVKPYRKLTIRIIKEYETQFRELLSISDEQEFRNNTMTEEEPIKYDWSECPEFIGYDNNIYAIHPHCVFLFYTEDDFNDFIAKTNFKLSKTAKTYWFPHKLNLNHIKMNGHYTTKKCHPQYPVYIPTYKRFETCYTARTLEELDMSIYIMVIRNETNEIENYRKSVQSFQLKHAKLLIIPDDFYKEQEELGNDYSVIPRNYIYKHALESGYTHHWCLDDNIKGFFRKNRGNVLPFIGTGFPLFFVEEYIKKYSNVYQAGIQYHHLSFPMMTRPPIILNSRVYSCMLIKHVDGFRWRGKYNEDTDLSIRLLKAGYATMTFQNILCGKQTTCTVKGGNTDDIYKTKDGYLKKANSIVEWHPDVTKFAMRYGHPHHFVDYRAFECNDLGATNYKMKLPEVVFIESNDISSTLKMLENRVTDLQAIVYELLSTIQNSLTRISK